jgi:hypothetical protein
MCMCTIRDMTAYNTTKNVWAQTISFYGRVNEQNGQADML